LRGVVGATKTYVVLFAEAEGFDHVHFHVVPRIDWFTQADLGPNVFHFLEEGDQVPAVEKERLAAELGDAIRASLGT
jgi:diadenosine tetraphosphate (Ap4A) HIT family hydrolase